MADDTIPSIPLAPRLASTRTRARVHVPVQVPGREAGGDPQQRAGRQRGRDAAGEQRLD